MQNLKRLVEWMRQEALPFWAENGFDHRSCRFAERLSFDGEHNERVAHRLMVQARQISVFCVAGANGWVGEAEAVVATAAGAMINDYAGRGLGGCWAFAREPNGDIDPAYDLYAHAFVLFALANLHRANGDGLWMEHADKTLSWLNDNAALDDGGYAETTPTPRQRRQNPHMHLFEACLEFLDAAAEPSFEPTARALLALAQDCMIASDTGALPETFSADWKTPAPDTWLEPGHHYEWIWLLDRAEYSLDASTGQTIDLLTRTARDLGHDAEGFIVNALDMDGAPIDGARRLWPQTEAIRAECTLAARGDSAALGRADEHVARLFSGFLDPAPAGCWIDRIAEDGTPLSEDVPASSLYHLMGAAVAADNASL